MLKKTKITTPVLFLVFNRPEKTRQSFEAIRQAKPRKLYVAADAPRNNRPEDIHLCMEVRDIVSNVDWECESHYLFHDTNLGCSLSGKTAWDWLFSHEERMIFIEDDGVPSISFFIYCQELLERYSGDDRIAYIGGVNYGLKYGNASYFFSRNCSATYSMATWKRVYDLYEYDMETYKSIRDSDTFKSAFCSKFSYKIHLRGWDRYIKSVNEGKRLNTYDTQMLYLVHKYKMLSIYPNINMVSNIGLDYGGANNNLNPSSSFAIKFGNRSRFEMTEINHPENISIDEKFEIKMFKQRDLYDRPVIYAKFDFFIKPILSILYHKIIK